MPVEKALLVDNNNDNTKFLEQCFVDLNFLPENIKVVADAEEGLKLAKTFRPQVVCTGWEIEPIPGTVFVQRLRNIRRCHYVPVLIYSQSFTDDDIFLTKELGLQGLVRLPFEKDSVHKTLEEMINAENNIDRTENKLRKIEYAIERDSLTEALSLVDSTLTKAGPHFVRSHTVLATLWYHLRKYDRAESMVKLALQEDPANTPTLQIMARIRSAQGHHEDAIQILQEMSELAPGNLSTMLNLGATFVEADRNDEAKSTLEQVYDLDPDNDVAKSELGKVAYKQGDHDRAKEFMSQTGQGNKMAKFFNDIAIALVNKGEFDKGIKTYRDAMKILSDSSKLHLLHYNLGLAFRKMGDHVAAFQEFCQSYIENPSYNKAYASLVNTSKEIKEAGGTLDSDLVKSVKNARNKKDSRAA